MLESILALAIILAPAFADPRQQLEAHARVAVERLCPCRGDVACPRDHRRIAHAISLVAETEADAVALIGLCAHESGCRDVDQMGGTRRAYGPWQIETSRTQRAAWRDDLPPQARWALRAWRAGATTYACGQRAEQATAACERAAGELRRYVTRAWWAWSAAR